MKPIIEVKNLFKEYKTNNTTANVLNDISFKVYEKQTLGIIGESGCGKSTLAKILMNLEKATSGDIFFKGVDSKKIENKERYNFIQMIFQDPYSSINPRKKVWELIATPLLIKKVEKSIINNSVEKVMVQVGLNLDLKDSYPHMLSGGQRQRIGIARAIILKPKVLILDEPISALDVSIQAQILNLLIKLQDEFNLTYIFIGHDLSIIQHISDNSMVMYLGQIFEFGNRDAIFNGPMHPYTKGLLTSSLSNKLIKSDQINLTGELPGPVNIPKGCALTSRCPFASKKCIQTRPELKNFRNRLLACHTEFLPYS